MKKKTFYNEAAYGVGLIAIALSVAMMQRADFGFSMIVAPAYILHRYISALPGMGFFSFGVAEYTLQAVILVILSIVVRRFRISYLFSFVTAVIYGYVLDLLLLILPTPAQDMYALRVAYFIVGELICGVGVSLMFRTYISPEAYDLFVSELIRVYDWPTAVVKTVYDISSLVVAVVLSFTLFGIGSFVGIGWGTVVCAACNGFVIGQFSKLWDRLFAFKDGLKLRRYFKK